ncbi:type I-E CRISPR-associated protein Cse2/CasB [Streptomyces sp. RK9]|uniref:type I-E CRISPR-associated protein Cse2/CasB n=1 Tax=Streptomyces sp. RK9 TaxID=3239284 RepID=UPI00386B9477
MTSAPRADTPTLVRQAAEETIGRLQTGYRTHLPASVAAVARLRREAGRDPHSTPTSWGVDDLEALTRLRDQAARRAEDDSADPASYPMVSWREDVQVREDRAVHLAVTLWALHQQSLREEPMHVHRWTLGRAARRLAEGRTGTQDRADSTAATHGADPTGAVSGGKPPAAVQDTDLSSSVRTRFVRIGTSTDVETLGVRLREMVLLLRAARIPLDYGLLAGQLDRWQQAAFRADVRREWGRGFHRVYAPSAPDAEATPDSPAEGSDPVASDLDE